MPVVFGVAVGGAIGASARYGLDRLIERSTATVFPLATFTINVTGCFLIGVISAALVDRHHLPAWLRVGLVVGVVGGYTTFSTFAQEALDLGTLHHAAVGAAYVAASVAVGIAAVYAGTRVGTVL
jgi:fluoride exporter